MLGPATFVVGRDTRESGPRLQRALTEGLVESGCDVVDLGVAPTPAVAHVAAREDSPAAVISASHNPWTDNGIKFFAPGGHKLEDHQQAGIEQAMSAVATDRVPRGDAQVHRSPTADYERTLESLVGDLSGLSIVVDCANGAAHEIAPRVLGATGARVHAMFDSPDGRNINEGCGSTHPQALSAAVVDLGADLGLCLDGDADRVLAADATGQLVDGDQIMALIALDRHSRGTLTGDAVVVTTMTNLGFINAMDRAGVEVVVTPVGDRHVIGAMRTGGYELGGEQSGHIIFGDVSTTGDGLLAGLFLAELVHRRGEPLAGQVRNAMTKLPQVLVSVAVDPDDDPGARIAPVRMAVEADLGDSGRVLVRPSGTEPVIRVMVEAATEERARAAAQRLAAAIRDGTG